MARRGTTRTGYAVLPDDAVMAYGTIGITAYYLPDLEMIDTNGLTDATVARNPVDRPDRARMMAHDRSPPPGYLEERGVNITIHTAASSEREAFTRAASAMEVGPDLWMPFDSDDPEWVASSLHGRAVKGSTLTAESIDRNRIHDGGRYRVGERFIGSFEDGFDGWTLEGEAVTNHSRHAVYERQSRISGNVGPGFLTS